MSTCSCRCFQFKAFVTENHPLAPYLRWAMEGPVRENVPIADSRVMTHALETIRQSRSVDKRWSALVGVFN